MILNALRHFRSLSGYHYGLPRPARGPHALPRQGHPGGPAAPNSRPFEEACQARGIRLSVLPPRSPKLNGCVERAQRTHTEEFYEVIPFFPGDRRPEPRAPGLGGACNTARPHQALGYLAPAQFLTRWTA